MAVNNATKKIQFWGTGRRKASTARVRLLLGNGNIIVNNKNMSDYFKIERLHNEITEPLTLTETLGKYDVICNVRGGGTTGQSGAIKLGIARALLKVDAKHRTILKQKGCLTSIAKKKERKKPGLKKARKAPQFSKR